MSIQTHNKMSSLFNSIITRVFKSLSEHTYPQASVSGVIGYITMIECISEVTYEATRILLEETIGKMGNKFRYSHIHVHQF